MFDIKDMLKDFFSDKFNCYLVICLIILGFFAYFFVGEGLESTEEQNKTNFTIYFFYLPTCSHCADQKIFNQQLIKDYNISIVSFDVSTYDGKTKYIEILQKYNITQPGVPLTIIGNRTFIGFDLPETTGKEMRAELEECLNLCKKDAHSHVNKQIPFSPFEIETIFGKVDLKNLSLPTVAVLLGTIDGFNPCAMWVLVYMIGLLIGIKDRKKIVLIVGSFVLASGILYFLFMTAWLNAFLLIGYLRSITVIVGLVALGAAILNFKSYFMEKTIVCKVGDVESKKKTSKTIAEIIQAPITLSLILAVIVLAFSVNLIEFLCSAAIPAIFTQLLALSNLSGIEYYYYILLYDFFYMLDDLIIFSLAVFSLSYINTSEKYVRICKVIGGFLLGLIGLILLFAPQLLK